MGLWCGVEGKEEWVSLLLYLHIEDKSNHHVTAMINDCYCHATLLLRGYCLVHIEKLSADAMKKINKYMCCA